VRNTKTKYQVQGNAPKNQQRMSRIISH